MRAENNMVNLVKEAQENKKKIIISSVVALLTLLGALPLFVIAGELEMAVTLRIVLICLGIIILIMGIAVTCVLDREAGYYECRNCHNRFVPTMGAYVNGAHTLTTRRLKCPECGKKTWCKRVLTK